MAALQPDGSTCKAMVGKCLSSISSTIGDIRAVATEEIMAWRTLACLSAFCMGHADG